MRVTTIEAPAEPQPDPVELPPIDGRDLVDELHPTGRCTCGGEGRCPWCLELCSHGKPFRTFGCLACTEAELTEAYAEIATLKAQLEAAQGEAQDAQEVAALQSHAAELLQREVAVQRKAGRNMLRALRSAQRSRARAVARARALLEVASLSTRVARRVTSLL